MAVDLHAKLRLTETFLSIQGESTRVGLPSVFIRLTGCPLRCRWCDTTYSFTGGYATTVAEVLAETAKYGVKTICVTGGEPLSQKGCLDLLEALCDAGYSVSLETSGALDIAPVDPRVSRIVDLKAPASGEVERNRLENYPLLRPHDEIKAVIANQEDYDCACQMVQQYQLAERCTVLFSPVAGELEPSQLAEWIVRDRLPVRMQLQLHKILWGSAQGR